MAARFVRYVIDSTRQIGYQRRRSVVDSTRSSEIGTNCQGGEEALSVASVVYQGISFACRSLISCLSFAKALFSLELIFFIFSEYIRIRSTIDANFVSPSSIVTFRNGVQLRFGSPIRRIVVAFLPRFERTRIPCQFDPSILSYY